MLRVKFLNVFPDNEGCGGLGDIFGFNWLALLLFYAFAGTLPNCIWFHPFSSG